MPDALVDAIRHHHASRAELTSLQGPHTRLAQITRFATCLGEYLVRDGEPQLYESLQDLAEHFFQLEESSLRELLDEMRDRTDDAAKLMSIDTDNLPRPSELLSRANAQLAEIALREHVAKTQVSARTNELELENRQLQQKNTHLFQQAETDGLTGVHNRRAFDEHFIPLVLGCLRKGVPVGVIFADVDNFKTLNDQYGHPFGDRVLQRLAAILSQVTRDHDLVARYGGEEFVVVTVDCEPSVVNTVAERIRSCVENEIIEFQGERIPVTISVGGSAIAAMEPNADAEPSVAQTMLEQADEAMYFCKRNGRNQAQVRTYEQSSQQPAQTAT
jgi:diguanylate cyclase (GGDEF)-like protein